ncbi:unnamed protein product [Porites evermanni]|uniref:Uncharacterized protein n=1 Tax=Porites evermanni TaxID=104178 RepID=A0ABN8M370_9CNID|nr:unnamed protein product [Porites evermanni]
MKEIGFNLVLLSTSVDKMYPPLKGLIVYSLQLHKEKVKRGNRSLSKRLLIQL